MKQKILSSGSKDQISAMETAYDRIRRYHNHQKMAPYSYTESNGSYFEMRVLPLRKWEFMCQGEKLLILHL